MPVRTDILYVGQTKCALKLASHAKYESAEHKAAIKNKNMDYAIARHYLKANHGSCASLKFWGIDIISPPYRGGDMIKLILRREAFWILTLNTMEAHGLKRGTLFIMFSVKCLI